MGALFVGQLVLFVTPGISLNLRNHVRLFRRLVEDGLGQRVQVPGDERALLIQLERDHAHATTAIILLL